VPVGAQCGAPVSALGHGEATSECCNRIELRNLARLSGRQNFKFRLADRYCTEKLNSSLPSALSVDLAALTPPILLDGAREVICAFRQ